MVYFEHLQAADIFVLPFRMNIGVNYATPCNRFTYQPGIFWQKSLESETISIMLVDFKSRFLSARRSSFNFSQILTENVDHILRRSSCEMPSDERIL